MIYQGITMNLTGDAMIIHTVYGVIELHQAPGNSSFLIQAI